ncbi:hypothetical protein [Halocatena pleomorpha]|uniref:Uncharacterized protein n=1 Tax=Halocatena pleomorpha TaxID=1785090 RepID=A0A3P3R9X1_9EURY|nr:hypothetical protein [Halocatena pleomorpha]RRJ30256.1 hypothetical protein EIK79_10045 [Halocatena pleomorpha]
MVPQSTTDRSNAPLWGSARGFTNIRAIGSVAIPAARFGLPFVQSPIPRARIRLGHHRHRSFRNGVTFDRDAERVKLSV